MTTNKLQRLAEIEGYSDVNDMLRDATMDSVSPGICINDDCEFTTDVEPDQAHGYCEECETNTVKSALMLAGIV